MKFGKWFQSQQLPDLTAHYIPYADLSAHIDRVVRGAGSEQGWLTELRQRLHTCGRKTAELLGHSSPSLRQLSAAWRFAHLNREAIRKITKKYDKLTGRCVSPEIATEVQLSPIAMETVLEQSVKLLAKLTTADRDWVAPQQPSPSEPGSGNTISRRFMVRYEELFEVLIQLAQHLPLRPPGAGRLSEMSSCSSLFQSIYLDSPHASPPLPLYNSHLAREKSGSEYIRILWNAADLSRLCLERKRGHPKWMQKPSSTEKIVGSPMELTRLLQGKSGPVRPPKHMASDSDSGNEASSLLEDSYQRAGEPESIEMKESPSGSPLWREVHERVVTQGLCATLGAGFQRLAYRHADCLDVSAVVDTSLVMSKIERFRGALCERPVPPAGAGGSPDVWQNLLSKPDEELVDRFIAIPVLFYYPN